MVPVLCLLLILVLIGSMSPVVALGTSTFEIDGNTTGANDWDSLAHSSETDTPTGSTDNSFKGGSSEDNPATVVEQGSIPNTKDDLVSYRVRTETLLGVDYLYLAWHRQIPGAGNGSATMDFEFNQAAQPPVPTTFPPAGAPWTLNRTVGDLLITYDYSGSGVSAVISARSWGGAVWGTPIILNTTTAEAQVSADKTFGEAAINLDVALASFAANCANLGSAFAKSRASDSFNAALKDLVKPVGFGFNSCPPPTFSVSGNKFR